MDVGKLDTIGSCRDFPSMELNQRNSIFNQTIQYAQIEDYYFDRTIQLYWSQNV